MNLTITSNFLPAPLDSCFHSYLMFSYHQVQVFQLQQIALVFGAPNYELHLFSLVFQEIINNATVGKNWPFKNVEDLILDLYGEKKK